MKIDLTKIKGELTDEQKVLLESIELEESYVDKKTFDKTASELAEAKKKLASVAKEGDEKNSTLQNELQELRTKVGQMEREKTIATHTAKFIALGYSEELANETATAMAENDFDKVFENQKKFLTNHDNDYKAKLIQGTPTPTGLQQTGGVTLDQFRKMTPNERYKYSVEHPEEYKKLYGGT